MNFFVTINHNSSSITYNSLLRNLELEPNSYFIVVDNSVSEDAERLRSKLEKLKLSCKESFKRLIFVESKVNLGFSHANNLGIKYIIENLSPAYNDKVVLINSDAHLLTSIPSYSEKLISNSIVGGQLLTGTPLKIQVLGGTDKVNSFGFGKNIGENQRPVTVMDEDERLTSVNGYINGAFMMFSLETFKKIGYLDESYFMWCEEVDYCLHAKRKGVSLLADLRIKVYHSIGGSSESDIEKTFMGRKSVRNSYARFVIRGYYHFRNALRVQKKFFPESFYLSLMSYFYDFIKRVVGVILYDEQKIKRISVMVKGFRDGIKGVEGKNEKI